MRIVAKQYGAIKDGLNCVVCGRIRKVVLAVISFFKRSFPALPPMHAVRWGLVLGLTGRRDLVFKRNWVEE
jgi:hypothetical protein